MGWLIWTIVLVLLGICLFCWFENNSITSTTYVVNADVTRPLKALQLTDLHSKQFGKGNRRLLDRIKREQPDFILFTGDTFDDGGGHREETLNFLQDCAALAPVVFIGGNHERRLKDREDLFRQIRQRGVQVLENELYTLNIQGETVCLLGLDEDQGSYEAYYQRARGTYRYSDNSELFGRLERHDGLRLVLCHYPENFALLGGASYRQYSFDAMFAGHAHGGQFRLPWIGGLYAPGQGLFPRYTAGKHGKGPYLIISRGLGRSSLYLRLFNRPELVIVKFVPE